MIVSKFSAWDKAFSKIKARFESSGPQTYEWISPIAWSNQNRKHSRRLTYDRIRSERIVAYREPSRSEKRNKYTIIYKVKKSSIIQLNKLKTFYSTCKSKIVQSPDGPFEFEMKFKNVFVSRQGRFIEENIDWPPNCIVDV